MHISILQAVLIGLVYYLGANGTPWLTVNMSWALRRPLISGILVGLILGDSVKGCMVGAAINVTYLAQITAGGNCRNSTGDYFKCIHRSRSDTCSTDFLTGQLIMDDLYDRGYFHCP